MGAILTGTRIGGGATFAPPPRAAPPPGPAAVLVPRTPASSFGCRPLDPVGSSPTGAWIGQPTSNRHARGQLDEIGGPPARCATSVDRDSPARRMTAPGRLVLSVVRRAHNDAGVWGVQRTVTEVGSRVNPLTDLIDVRARCRLSRIVTHEDRSPHARVPRLGVHEVNAVVNTGSRALGERVGHPHDVCRIHVLLNLIDAEPAHRKRLVGGSEPAADRRAPEH